MKIDTYEYVQLLKRKKLVFDAFETFCLNSDNYVNPYTEVLRLSKKEEHLEFEVIGKEFLFIGEVVSNQHTLVLRTYEVCLNLDNPLSSKLIHVKELDIVFPYNGVMRFAKKFTGEITVSGHQVEVNLSELNNFGVQYIDRVTDYICAKQEREMPVIEG